eukprot:754429-Hanusia_phi.AAC.2
MKSIENVLEVCWACPCSPLIAWQLNGKFCDTSSASRDYDSQRGSPTVRPAIPPQRSPMGGSPMMNGQENEMREL